MSEEPDSRSREDDTHIRPLDEDTVARIAAGEVVERPASAVKELLENSLDADASRIAVAVEAGGTDRIRVADDGVGMTEADLRAAVRQHTTSKIDDLSDLETGVATLGFRGEALHTIGSVSKLTIRSRPRADRVDDDGGTDGIATGTELVYEGGEVTSVGPTGCPEGTIVEVTDLFYNTPARRKFLKTTATEFAHVNRIVTRYALANPDVAISLSHDGREVFATTGQGDLQAAVLAVYGREVAGSMIDLDVGESDLPSGPLESVSGLVSHPETNRSSREYLATFVNDRAVTSDAIREGIMGAYEGQLGGDRYPFVVCFLEVPGEAVDVNVHPRKREVRFDDDDTVRRQVEAAVKEALLDHGLLRSRAPRGRSAPEEARIEPERGEQPGADGTSSVHTGDSDSSRDERSSASVAGSATQGKSGEIGPGTENESASEREEKADFDSDASTDYTPSTERNQYADPTAGTASADSTESASSIETNPAAEPEESATETDESAIASQSAQAETSTKSSESTESDPSAEPRPSTQSDAHAGSAPRSRFFPKTEQRTLEGDVATDETEFDSLPPLRVLGQFDDTYLICETTDGLLLIDQHAADERVHYERLRDAFASNPSAQTLASPVEVELTAVEAESFGAYREALSRLGFYADRTDDRTVAVTTVPAVLEKALEPDRLRDVLAAFVAGDRDSGAETVDALADEFLADLACYPSITGNTSLTEGSVVDLLDALDECENPYACPHGRPVIVQIDRGEIEDRFERDYPGHSG